MKRYTKENLFKQMFHSEQSKDVESYYDIPKIKCFKLDTILRLTKPQEEFLDLCIEFSSFVYNYFWHERMKLFQAQPHAFFALAHTWPLFLSQYTGLTIPQLKNALPHLDQVSRNTLDYAESLQWLDFCRFMIEKRRTKLLEGKDQNEWLDPLSFKRENMSYFSTKGTLCFRAKQIKLSKLHHPIAFRCYRTAPIEGKLKKVTIVKEGSTYTASLFITQSNEPENFHKWNDLPFSLNLLEGSRRGLDRTLQEKLRKSGIQNSPVYM